MFNTYISDFSCIIKDTYNIFTKHVFIRDCVETFVFLVKTADAYFSLPKWPFSFLFVLPSFVKILILQFEINML